MKLTHFIDKYLFVGVGMFKKASWIAVLGLLAACSSAAPSTAAVGQPAPAFTEMSVDGSQVRLSDYNGQAVLLYFSMADG
jgi:hypothetical protein